MSEPTDDLDVLIIGAGPAGLSAALMLGRCLRRVVVVDSGTPRNAGARAAHGYFTREGCAPSDLRAIGREQLAAYDVPVFDDLVEEVRRSDRGFCATTRSGRTLHARKLLLATGVRDRTPAVPGLAALYGRSVVVCPYCDAYEVRGRRLAVWSPGYSGPDVALGLTTWSPDVTLFAASEVGCDDLARLERNGVRVVREPVAALDGEGEELRHVVLAGGARVACDRLFVHFGCEQAAPFAVDLGCALDADGSIPTGAGERAGAPGLYIAGDASEDLNLIAVAVAEGVRAACHINTALRRERER